MQFSAAPFPVSTPKPIKQLIVQWHLLQNLLEIVANSQLNQSHPNHLKHLAAIMQCKKDKLKGTF